MPKVFLIGMWAVAILLGIGVPASAQDSPDAQALEEKGRAAESFGTVPDPPIERALPLPRHEAGKQETTPGTSKPEQDQAEPEWWNETKKALTESAPADSAQSNAANNSVAPRNELGGQLMRTLSWLMVLCGIIVLGGYVLRRYGKNTPILAGRHYGAVLAKVYLSPRASLHYVKSGGRVLVIGLTQNNMSLIAEFDADAFESAEATAPETEIGVRESFLDALRAAGKPPASKSAIAEDDELATLRGDVQRLQRYLQDNLRESAE